MENEQADFELKLPALLVEQAPDAVIFANTEGVIQVWNAAATRIFGFAREEALGRSLDIIIPERLREAHWRGFNRAIANRIVKYVSRAMPTRATRADGSKMYVELSFSIVLDPNRTAVGSLAHGRDITERFEKEKARAGRAR